MLGPSFGLDELVLEARDRVFARGRLLDWLVELGGCDLSQASWRQMVAAEWAAQVIRLSAGGRVLCSPKILFADVGRDLPPQAIETEHFEDYGQFLFYLREEPAWVAFDEVVALAERIDAFLGVMERG